MKLFEKIGKALLFPHIAIMLLLAPVATVFLVYAMLHFDLESPVSIASYVLAAYTLTVWCVKIPKIIKLVKAFQHENKYAIKLGEDVRLRVNISLLAAFIWNVAYSLFQLWLGFTHASFWFYSMAGYYISLAFMRYFMFGYTRRHLPGEKMKEELKKYRTCGWVFLIMNLAVTLMIFFMVYWNRTFIHHEITTITMAAYTFTTFTFAIVNIVKYRKYNSPVYSASKAISLAAACVSMITLTSTMLTTFGKDTTDLVFRRLILGLLGTAVSAFIIGTAIYMILQGTKKLKMLNTEVTNEQSHQ